MGYPRTILHLLFMAALCLISTGPVVFSQPPTPSTRILDTLYNPNGTKARAVIKYNLNCPNPTISSVPYTNRQMTYCMAPTGSMVQPQDCDVVSNNPGEVDITLVPTATGSNMVPASCRYTARYTFDTGASFSMIWNVPVSGSTVRLRDIESSVVAAPSNSSVPMSNVSAGGQADGCVRLVSGRLQTFNGPNCAVPQAAPFESNVEYTFTNVSTITVPGSYHNYQTRDMVFQCYKSDGSWMLCGSGGVDPVSYEVVMTWATNVTGYLIIGGRSGVVANRGFSFNTPSTTWTIPQSQTGAAHHRIMATCYDNTLTGGKYNWFFCAPNVDPITFDISFSFGTPKTGRVALMIK